MTIPRTWRGRVFIATSLDGYIARRDGDISWLTDPPADIDHAPPSTGAIAPPDYETFMADIDHVVVGRATYETARTFAAWPYTGKDVVVLSTSLALDHDERILIARDLDDAVHALDRNGARHVYVDGGQVIQAFLRADLIDELTIAHAPILLGTGLPLFAGLDRDTPLSLRASATIGAGMTQATYHVLR